MLILVIRHIRNDVTFLLAILNPFCRSHSAAIRPAERRAVQPGSERVPDSQTEAIQSARPPFYRLAPSLLLGSLAVAAAAAVNRTETGHMRRPKPVQTI